MTPNARSAIKSILVVEDEEALVVALELILSPTYRVLKAATGEEALISVKECKPDLILLDIMMPGLGGLETLKLLKSHPKFKAIPVVLMSGARPLVNQTDYQWSDFLEKPFTADQLRTTVRKFI
jgi:CheY-like chemotaxis protein